MAEENLVQAEPATAPCPQPEAKSQLWKYALFAVLGLLLLAGITYAGYWYGIKSEKLKAKSEKLPAQPAGGQLKTENLTPTLMPVVTSLPALLPEITLSPDETVGWKSYTNTKYGYSISYPNNWDVKEFPAESVEGLEVASFNPDKVTDRISAIFITVSPRPYEQEAIGSGNPIKVGDFTGKKIYGGAPPDATNVYLRVVAPLGTESIIFESSTDYEEVFDLTLSTFKFLD